MIPVKAFLRGLLIRVVVWAELYDESTKMIGG